LQDFQHSEQTKVRIYPGVFKAF